MNITLANVLPATDVPELKKVFIGNTLKIEKQSNTMENSVIDTADCGSGKLKEKDPEILTMFYNDVEVYQKQLEEFLKKRDTRS